jgi:hypothetical protein
MTATLLALAASLVLAPSAFQQRADTTAKHVLSGRVVDGSTGKPMIGAVVALWEPSETRSSGKRVTVGANGVFEFVNVSPGSYKIAPEMPGLQVPYRTETIDVEVRDGSITGLGLIITPLGPRAISVSGKVVMERGGPISSSITTIKTTGDSSTVQRDGTFQLQFRAKERYKLRLEELPEGAYIKSLSAGSWDSISEILIFDSTPPSTLQITLGVGTRSIRGQVLDRTGTPAVSRTSLTLAMQSASAAPQDISINQDGTFLIGRLRAGDYELKAMQGSGTTMQFASLPLTIGEQDRSGIELRLKPVTRQKGRVVIEGAGRVEDLQRFRLVIEVVDVLGVHPVPIAADGTFEFQSFEGGYSAKIKDLPLGYEPSIVIAGSSVEVKLRIVQRDAPF